MRNFTPYVEGDGEAEFALVNHYADGGWNIAEGPWSGKEILYREMNLIHEVFPGAPVPTLWDAIEDFFDGYTAKLDNTPWAFQCVKCG